MRAVVVGTTGLFATVDRTVVTATRLIGGILKNPEGILQRFTSQDSVQMRADIGTSVVLVALVIVVVLILMFV
jgi:multicomponent Na+:H+ antiporter subunit D